MATSPPGKAEAHGINSPEFIAYLKQHLYRAKLIVYSMLLAAGVIQIIIREHFPEIHPPWHWIGGTLIVVLLGIVCGPPVLFLIRAGRQRESAYLPGSPLSGSKPWDATFQEQRWRNSLVNSRRAMDQLRSNSGKSPSGFYVLCLAEVDAVATFTRPECFTSRAALIAEFRRLIAHPTTPSEPVPSLEAYIQSQKTFLEMEIKSYEVEY